MSEDGAMICPACGRDRGNREPHKPGCARISPEQAIRAAWKARYPRAVIIAGPAPAATLALGAAAEASSPERSAQAAALRTWVEILADAVRRMEADGTAPPEAE